MLLASEIATISAAFMSIIAGWCIKYGRRKVLIISNLLMIFSGLTMVIPLYPFLIISRTIRGIAIGTFSVVVPVFIKEISFVKIRAQLISVSQIMVAIGIMFGYFVSLLLPKFEPISTNSTKEYGSKLDDKPVLWPLVYGFPIVPAIIQLGLLLFKFQDDSPRYYDQNGLFQELVGEIFNPNDATTVSLGHSPSASMSRDVDKYHDTYRMLLNLKYFRATYIGIIVLIFRQLTGINMLHKYAYFYDIVKHQQHGLKFVIGMINGVFTGMSLLIVKYFGRKSIIQTGFLITGGGNALLYQVYQEDFTSTHDAYTTFVNLLTIFTALIFSISFALTVGTVGWIYSVETMTSKGFSIAVCGNWLTTFTVNMLPWIFIEANHNTQDTEYYKNYMSAFFFVFSTLSICGFFIILVFVQETKGKSEQDISKMYENRYFDTLKTEPKPPKSYKVLKVNESKYDL